MRCKLRERRKTKRLSVQEMAKMLNISPSFYYKIEQAIRNPTISLAKKIADILDSSVDNLFYAQELDDLSNRWDSTSSTVINK